MAGNAKGRAKRKHTIRFIHVPTRHRGGSHRMLAVRVASGNGHAW